MKVLTQDRIRVANRPLFSRIPVCPFNFPHVISHFLTSSLEEPKLDKNFVEAV